LGSGISTKYEKTYFYKLKEDNALSVSEKSYEYIVHDTHTIESHNDNEVIEFCKDMVSRKPFEDSSYAQNLANTAQHFEMNDKGFFGSPGQGKNVWVIESEEPMHAAMNFYREISEGGITDYTENHHGVITMLKDGINILFRPYPKTDGSPAVDIMLSIGDFLKKIHFIQR